MDSQTQKEKVNLQPPKGTVDIFGEEAELQDYLFGVIRKWFKLFDTQELQTPIFERKEILMGKYGEDEKLIFELKEQGGLPYVLRYDHTVPFARYIAQNNLTHFKRFCIGPVFRRDNPSLKQGRMRQFYQADFDIAGSYQEMYADSELINILMSVFYELGFPFKIKINNRVLLDGIFMLCGVSDADVRKVSSSIDKLDKTPWDKVEEELKEKDISNETANKLRKVFQDESLVKSNNFNIFSLKIKTLLKDTFFDPKEETVNVCLKGIKQLETLNKILWKISNTDPIEWNLTLARGLDYYTGLIYEIVGTEHLDVGSISGGGRYDNLVNMFNDKRHIPCVGGSFGIDRILTILKRMKTVKHSTPPVIVVPIKSERARLESCKIADYLRSKGIKTHLKIDKKINLSNVILEASKNGVKYMILVGDDEIENGRVKLKLIEENTEIEDMLDNCIAKILS